MVVFDFIQQYDWAYLLFTLFIGLAVGSFLNVVILRLPKMMENQWRSDCAELNGEQATTPSEPYNLSQPASHCPKCRHKIRFWENIPVISWLLLRGRCSNCKAPISPRYPVIEAMTGLFSFAVAYHFGFTWATLAALFLTWALIALSVIDFDVQLLPDNITLPFLWLGLLISLGNVFTDPRTALIGAAAGYLSLWSVYQLFKRLTGKEGMGYGDFKLLAMLGAWLGWHYLPQIILLSALVGAVVGILLIVVRGRDRNIPIPFGPYLAAAGWISLMWGEQINTAYLRWSGMM
ncbi:MAG: A24 family peptidase [Candidatus Thiodiazotropha endolucinida]|uniref:Prepilin leader peptidase/N-methyltransferase n=2 Tax=Candidatus Thiodiazotropha TaxID=1913444 RepID=A0A7Z0VNA0_9GAMM|nr:A24 family peptidase [Candidatus Thiodiazotropha endolucinida]MBT3033386.1 A24 family peptidase [Candidatus Thiodiazotropha sp. (ex Lucina pensylvanica)]MBT3051071.1 A24 family peptidase [Candidatus Thiodiazotropha sp. (ex Codakia orbicularis)]MCG8047622.1 A24 family peptidase [Candidatus Thiodiazotropha taylori]MCG8065330.1 A24 family peptidase [Candidatus Thiodiazotropha taylori]MCG8093587.1 A24 family peptidase [Candidatus Thiodiazotropha endolucinida]